MSELQPYTSGRPVPSPDEELFDYTPRRVFRGSQLREIAFPLGGIGTGCVSLSGRGELVDWEILNRPHKGYRPAHSYFVLHAQEEGGEPIFRVLEGRLQPPYTGHLYGAGDYYGFGFGSAREFGAGFVRFEDCSFTNDFPFARVDLADASVPVTASIEAWSPFIPGDPDHSSYPVAVFTVTLTNRSAKPVDTTVALGLENIIGRPETGLCRNEWAELDGGRGILMSSERHDPASPRYGTLALVTPDEDVTYQLRFAGHDWFAETETLMDEFGVTGRFAGPTEPETGPADRTQVGHLGVHVQLAPGEAKSVDLILCWHMPNFEMYWAHGKEKPTWKAWHGVRWSSAREVAEEVLRELPELRRRTRAFADTFFSSTLPGYVLDAVSSQASTLRTPTVMRLPDGTLWGWEGCHSTAGCCPGTCTHVWTYAQTVAFLFPSLERDMRKRDFEVDLREDGHMQFRMPLPAGTLADHAYHAAADGQMGNVLRTYREWQTSGDEEWLRSVWPAARKALEYAWVEWDADRDGLMEGVHHNTLDIEYHGPETVCGSMYLAGLRAGEEMARHVGDTEAADAYRAVFESGSRLSDAELFNGEYYFQKLAPDCEEPYQFGTGCICDQLLGQWHARVLGLGDLFDPEHIRTALASLYRHNFRDDFLSHNNPHRVYALGDEKGLLLCTWPLGGRPKVSVTYAFECWLGCEYQVGAHLVHEGMLREGLTLCKAVRDRQDGERRNPYNEIECGSHYARSMSNYAYLGALSGLRYSAVERTLTWAPRIRRGDFACFFSVAGAWGIVSERQTVRGLEVTIDVREGSLAVDQLVVDGTAVTIDGAPITPGQPMKVEVPGMS